MDGAAELFQRFQNEGIALIEKTVSEGWTETLFLDFKAAANGKGPMQKEDRANLGKALLTPR